MNGHFSAGRRSRVNMSVEQCQDVILRNGEYKLSVIVSYNLMSTSPELLNEIPHFSRNPNDQWSHGFGTAKFLQQDFCPLPSISSTDSICAVQTLLRSSLPALSSYLSGRIPPVVPDSLELFRFALQYVCRFRSVPTDSTGHKRRCNRVVLES